MSHVLNKHIQLQGENRCWQPSASIEALKARAKLLADIRQFFHARDVLEVETPLLCATAATDPYIHAISAYPSHQSVNQSKEAFYLQTSPEFAMKRLLAAGSGPIFQLCKAFRDGDLGRYHNPEFTILEWYRPGFDHHKLMDEMDELLQMVLHMGAAKRMSYQELFEEFLRINPHEASLAELQELSLQKINMDPKLSQSLDSNDYLHILLTHCIEPHIGFDAPVMIYDYPKSQAALAKIRQREGNQAAVAERFEVYVRGIELANGYHELTNAANQLERFKQDIHFRKELQIAEIPIDMRLIEALTFGMPDCAGVALGVDRLLMIKEGYKDIRECLSFSIDLA